MHNLGRLPRCIIIMIDFMVLSISFLFTFLLFKGIGINYLSTNHSGILIFSFFETNLFFFWLFRTQSGIIRHSSNIDVVKRLFLEMSVLIVFFIGNFLIKVFFNHKAFLNTALFNNIVLFFVGCFYTVSS